MKLNNKLNFSIKDTTVKLSDYNKTNPILIVNVATY